MPGALPLLESTVLRRGPVATIATTAPIDKLYSYIVPDALADKVVPGMRVRIPLGSSARLVEAWCIERTDAPWDTTLREIHSVIDDAPLLPPALLDLALWITRYYACPVGPALRAVAPSASRREAGWRPVKYVELTAPGAPPTPPDQSTAGRPEVPPPAAAPRKATAKRQSVLDLLARSAGPQPLDAVCRAADVGPAVIKALVRNGLISITLRREPRDLTRESDGPVLAEPAFDLNPEQYAAAERIVAAMSDGAFHVLVLFGVTGSGKTEVYIRAIRHAIAQGKQAILLVPEIALTTQTVQRLTRRFSRVALVHSRVGAARRAAIWAAAAAGDIDLIIGTRSAVFAPCRSLGVVVVDEEQESSFKHMAAPRYHTRDVAIKRAHLESIPVVLGSATPSLETWHNVRTRSHYELLRLPRRVGGLEPPRLHLVDMRLEHKARKGVHLLSRDMERYLTATLTRREQAVLLLNRRGFANYLFCPSCNTPIVCPNCGVYMVFHQATDLAHCHYCNARIIVPAKCSMAGCGGTLVRFGMGTERVEQELRVKFPAARAARMDSDVMTRPADYASVLTRFEKRELDVLIGTQMIAKGLDYPFVSFVGVISADTALAIDDFRSTERTFQLVLQVAGRAARSDRGGDVVVQTFNADLPTIRHALMQDYERFAEEELSARRKTRLPPITRLVRIVLSDPRLSRARDESAALVSKLRETTFAAALPGHIDDARPCSMPRLRNQYRYEILLWFDTAAHMLTTLDRLRAEGSFKARVKSLTIDVDPMALQ